MSKKEVRVTSFLNLYDLETIVGKHVVRVKFDQSTEIWTVTMPREKSFSKMMMDTIAFSPKCYKVLSILNK